MSDDQLEALIKDMPCVPLHVERAVRLSNAAPKMLETLREIRSWLTSPDLSPNTIAAYQHDCDLAIEKACGKSKLSIFGQDRESYSDTQDRESYSTK